MRITVRLIGRYKTITGKETFELDLKEGDTLRDVIDILVKHYPETERDKKFMMVFKNKQNASLKTLVEKGDEITISPPIVSGG